VIADIYIYLRSNDYQFLISALTLVVWYLHHNPHRITEHLESIQIIFSEWMTALVEKQIRGILVFFIAIEKLNPSINAFMYSFVTPVILASRLLNLESFIEKSEKMGRLMRFFTSEAMTL
jgi:hypothetical protein